MLLITIPDQYPNYYKALEILRGTVCFMYGLTLKVLVATIDARWKGMGDVGSERYEPALLPPMPDHKAFKLHELVNFQKFSTLRVNTHILLHP